MTLSDEPFSASRRKAFLDGADFEAMYAMYVDYCAPDPVRLSSADRRTGRFWTTHLTGLPDPDRLGGIGTALSEVASDSAYELGGQGRPDGYVVRVQVRGTVRTDLEGQDLAAGHTIQGPEQRLTQAISPGSVMRYLVVPPAKIADALRVRLGEEPRGLLHFDPEIRHQAPAAAAWLALVNSWADPRHAQLLAQSPLALRHFEQLLIQALLDAQPHALTTALTRHTAAAPPGSMRRAMAYCEEHAHEPISVAHMAAAAGLSVRQLQRGFREHLGISPLEHLRRVRLDQVHQELLEIAAGRATGTITEIATRWGFAHLGRFSEYYRGTYGRPPSHTLRAGAA
ncbi:helix-turn-helix domain-containing protein [Crossiella sp. CA198]|uniref:AraC family transcriptional regulator n=1 Tax=Crossiella sp. CA198 TaxID=3455607 RepID=UPI003F8D4305